MEPSLSQCTRRKLSNLSLAYLTFLVGIWTGGFCLTSAAAETLQVIEQNKANTEDHIASTPFQPHVTPPNDHPLAATTWRLVAFQSMSDSIGTIRPEEASSYMINLHADGTVTMRLNCNRATGKWFVKASDDAQNGRFEFGPLATTKALCPTPSMDEKIAADAQFIRSYLLKDDRLYLSLMADGGIYEWQSTDERAQVASFYATPEAGGARNWEVTGISTVLNLRQEPTATARVLTTYAPGTILDNLGCQSNEGRIWCDVQQLGGGPRGFVAAEFLTPAVSPNGKVAKGPDNSALRAGQGEFDATGQVPCARYPGQPMRQCAFGVARAGGGYATVVIKKPDGLSRAIYFRMGKPIGADTSEADGYHDFNTTQQNDLHIISVGPERYEIPSAVVLGG